MNKEDLGLYFSPSELKDCRRILNDFNLHCYDMNCEPVTLNQLLRFMIQDFIARDKKENARKK